MTDVTLRVFYSLLFMIVLSNNDGVRCQLSGFTGNESGLPKGVMSILKFLQSQQEPPEVEENECGRITKREHVALMHGGHDSIQGEWPWHGALYHMTYGSTSYKCGCTLIFKSRVVTAAHCVVVKETGTLSENSLMVSFGTIKKTSPDSNRKQVKVIKLKVHEEYDKNYNYNDIAILDIESIELNEFIKPACIWKDKSNTRHVDNRYGTVIGWGLLENNAESETLQKVRLPVVRDDLCKQIMDKYINERKFCIGELNVAKNPCEGDSGGGVFFNETSNGIETWYLGGVVSLALMNEFKGCNTANYTAHTLVEKYYDFITMKIE